jgi:hypothetical protein
MAAKKVLVYPVISMFADGFQCEHAVCDPSNEGDIVLCEECSDATEAGAEIVRVKEEPRVVSTVVRVKEDGELSFEKMNGQPTPPPSMRGLPVSESPLFKEVMKK